MTDEPTRRQIATTLLALGTGALAAPAAFAQTRAAPAPGHSHPGGQARTPTTSVPERQRETSHAHAHGGPSDLKAVADKSASAAEACFAYALKVTSALNPILLDCARTAAAVVPVTQSVAKFTTLNSPRFGALVDVAVAVVQDCEVACRKVAAYHPPVAACLAACRDFIRVAITVHPSPANLALVGGPFDLVDHRGNPLSSRSLDDKPYVLVFGYTLCPDYCPTVLALLSNLLDQLGKDRALPVLFVSLDERDTPERLAQYVSAFHPSVVGLTGPRPAIDSAVERFRATYEVSDRPPADYAIDHTMTIYLMRGTRCVALTSLDEPEHDQLGKLRALVAG